VPNFYQRYLLTIYSSYLIHSKTSGKIVFTAPSRPLVTQQIEACHNTVGIPQVLKLMLCLFMLVWCLIKINICSLPVLEIFNENLLVYRSGQLI
jgi:hypothetical protein